MLFDLLLDLLFDFSCDLDLHTGRARIRFDLKHHRHPRPTTTPLARHRGYNGPSAGSVGASLRGRGAPGDDGGLMGQVCAEGCQCSFQGTGPEDLPFCKDEPDQPALGRLCSLCGPGTFCPGCNPGNSVIINLFFRDP